ncbi:MAG TPA: hypothetical protein VF713_13380 [Thermoanaerobaculia bacterium]
MIESAQYAFESEMTRLSCASTLDGYLSDSAPAEDPESLAAVQYCISELHPMARLSARIDSLVKSVIELVVDYSLGGFAEVSG